MCMRACLHGVLRGSGQWSAQKCAGRGLWPLTAATLTQHALTTRRPQVHHAAMLYDTESANAAGRQLAILVMRNMARKSFMLLLREEVAGLKGNRLPAPMTRVSPRPRCPCALSPPHSVVRGPPAPAHPGGGAVSGRLRGGAHAHESGEQAAGREWGREERE